MFDEENTDHLFIETDDFRCDPYEGVFVAIQFPNGGVSEETFLNRINQTTDSSQFKLEQIDDQFGVSEQQVANGYGDDVIVWVEPLFEGNVQNISGLTVGFNVLRNSTDRQDIFWQVMDVISKRLHGELKAHKQELAQYIQAIQAYWQSQGITPGSDDALMMDI